MLLKFKPKFNTISIIINILGLINIGLIVFNLYHDKIKKNIDREIAKKITAEIIQNLDKKPDIFCK